MKKCKYCEDGELVLRDGKFGNFYGCTNFPSCAGRENISRAKSEEEKQADEWLRRNSQSVN